jgi:outer membrane scaffolding protein for murein synthesis (MipA/OmpV family)
MYGGDNYSDAGVRPAYAVRDACSIAPALIASYRVDPQWLVGLLLGCERFSDRVRKSPLVQQAGRLNAVVGLDYVWR